MRPFLTLQSFYNLICNTILLYDLKKLTTFRLLKMIVHLLLIIEKCLASLAWKDLMVSVKVASSAVRIIQIVKENGGLLHTSYRL